MLHWDGMTWSPSVTGTMQGFHGMFATPSGGVFAGGDYGMILHHP